jgi:hypothetical protein
MISVLVKVVGCILRAGALDLFRNTLNKSKLEMIYKRGDFVI